MEDDTRITGIGGTAICKSKTGKIPIEIGVKTFYQEFLVIDQQRDILLGTPFLGIMKARINYEEKCMELHGTRIPITFTHNKETVWEALINKNEEQTIIFDPQDLEFGHYEGAEEIFLVDSLDQMAPRCDLLAPSYSSKKASEPLILSKFDKMVK